jgi:DNA-binding transcriptional LysR family regulator
MNLGQLAFAVAVADKKSFTGAAAQCHVTQPTLSNGIAQLEDELGGRLFVRTTRIVSLTPLGTHLVPYIREVLAAQAALLNEAQSFLNPEKQMIRIGMSPLVNTHLLGLMLEPFRRQHPDIGLILREMNMVDLYRMLNEGLLDYVFGVADTHKEGWTATFLYGEPLLYIPSGAEPRGKQADFVNLRDIADETYVMVPDACGLSRATRALFRSQRKTLHEYPGQALSYHVLEDWAALKVGAAILPESKVTDKKGSARTIQGKGGEVVRISFEAVWPQERVQAAHLKFFENHLRKTVPGVLKGLTKQSRNA